MQRAMVRVSAASLAVGLPWLLSSAASAQTNPNADEWNLINLTSTEVSGANGGSGVAVAVYDGYADCRHSDLSGDCANVKISGGRYRFYDNHGTHVSGIVTGTKYGVASNSDVINYAVFDDRKYIATGSKLIDAWRHAWNTYGAPIANMSFGCASKALCFTAAEVTAMADANLPMLFVKAAGNDAVNLVNETILVSPETASAALQRTILVGSVDVNGTLSSFSNKPGEGCLLPSGTSSCSDAYRWKNYFIVAPGRSIYSTLPGNKYGYMSGTSMAAPIVSGAAALLKAKWPALAPETLADILFQSATDLGAAGVDPVYGWGLLNVAQAFQANGTVTLVSPSGTTTTMNGTTTTTSPTFSRFAQALGGVTVWDSYGRDYSLAESGALRLAGDINASRHLMGRRMLGQGTQAEWAQSFFARRHAPHGFIMFTSPGDPFANVFTHNPSLRMGVDLPFKGGVAQVRMTGDSMTRLDFAHDPTLRPLSLFASTDLLKNSTVVHGLINVSKNSRLALYATSTSGSIAAQPADAPFVMRMAERGSATRLALTGHSVDQRQTGVGVGYWMRPDERTVVGLNASILSQKGGYYDIVTDLSGFDKPTRVVNIGLAASRSVGSWEVNGSGELTQLSMKQFGAFAFSGGNIVSGELSLRKIGVAFAAGSLRDSFGLALVLPPRAVSGSLMVEHLTRTQDGLGRKAALYRYPLSKMGSDPLKMEAAYRVSGDTSWSLDISGGLNMRRSDYGGRGEALASFRLGF